MFCSLQIRQLHSRYDGRVTSSNGTYLVELRRVWPISWRGSIGWHRLSAVCLQRDRTQIRHHTVSYRRQSKFLRTGGLRTRSVLSSSVRLLTLVKPVLYYKLKQVCPK